MESTKLFTIVWDCLPKQSSLYIWQSPPAAMVKNQSILVYSVKSNFSLIIN